MECGYCWGKVICSVPETMRENNTLKLKTLCYCPHCKQAWYFVEKFQYKGWEEETIKKEDN